MYGGEDQLLVPVYWSLLQNHGGIRHGLHRRKIRLIEGNAKCRHLKRSVCKGTLRQVFIRVYIVSCVLYTFSHVGIFNPALGSVNKYTVNTYTVCVCGGGGGLWGSVGEQQELNTVSGQIQNLKNCYTTLNKNLGWETASDR